MDKYVMWYAKCKLPYHTKIELLKKFNNLKEIWYYSIHKKNNNIINYKIIDILNSSWCEEELERDLEYLKKKKIKICFLYNDDYPIKLKNINDPPITLFYIGDISKVNNLKNVAIVGSRKNTSYGLNVTNIISRELTKRNINIISGMARGIDTIAHTVSIKNGGFTCAVLGSGIDVIYPKDNTELYKKIIANGCVISEFLPGTKPLAHHFPIRNRIISGLCDILIVVEASEKSGSLITATFALEQGKDVMAVPGSLFNNESKGTNKLIKEGAFPLTELEDVFNLLDMEYIKKKEVKENIAHIDKLIYNLISDVPIHIDEMVKSINIDIKKLYELLFEMQLDDKIICLPGNFYVRAYKEI